MIKIPLNPFMLQCLYTLCDSFSVFRKDTLHLCCINTQEEMRLSMGQIKAILLCGWMKQTPG